MTEDYEADDEDDDDDDDDDGDDDDDDGDDVDDNDNDNGDMLLFLQLLRANPKSKSPIAVAGYRVVAAVTSRHLPSPKIQAKPTGSRSCASASWGRISGPTRILKVYATCGWLIASV